MNAHSASRTALQVATAVGALVLIAVIIWVDVATTIWQEMVILSGLAAALVSFLLTTVFVNRFLQRQLEARWAPVTHMALTAVLHRVADEERSDLERGQVVPRSLPLPAGVDRDALRRELDRIRAQVQNEREHLSDVLGTWSQFLTSTGDNSDVMRAAASLALQFDHVRDAALEAEERLDAAEGGRDPMDEISARIQECNQRHRALIDALEARIREHIARQRPAE